MVLAVVALKQKSKEILRILSESFFGKIDLISVGGIDNAQEAYERIRLGASLVQVYSGLVFQGPSLCKNINEGLLQCLRADGLRTCMKHWGRILKQSQKHAKSQMQIKHKIGRILKLSLRQSQHKQERKS